LVALTKFTMSDLARQKRVEVDLTDGGAITGSHSVSQAVEHYRERLQIPDRGLRWTAFSRGVMLDGKSRLRDVPEIDDEWTVMPEVSAG